MKNSADALYNLCVLIIMRLMLIRDISSQGSRNNQLHLSYMLGVELSQIKEENQHLRSLHQQSQSEIHFLKDENARLKEQLRLAQLRQFGKKSEQAGEPGGNSAEKQVTISAHTRRMGKKTRGRLLDTTTLPRYVFHHDLPTEEKNCTGCSNPLHLISKESAEQLEIVPLRVYVAEHMRYKYGCRTCQTIVMGRKEPAPLPKAIAGSTLLTEILVNKYQFHLPLYRQSKMLAGYQVTVPDNTLGNWVMQIGSGLMKLYDALWACILAQSYLQVDETPVKVQKPDKKGYMWTYYAPHLGGGVVAFEMSLTRSGQIAMDRLSVFKGLLQTDGYNGYHALRQRNDITGLGCITHARRKFSEVMKVTKNTTGIAAEAIERLKPLYALEKKMREGNLSFHTKKRLRQRIAWPILKLFHSWLRQQIPKVPPKSTLGQAIQYTLRQWPYLIKYTRHGMAEIDTNGVENQIRDIAVGKKNWMHIGHKESGKIHALFYSLVLTCVLNDLNPRVYLHYVISRLHDLRKGKVEAITLLPHIIDRETLKEFSERQIETGKKVLNFI